MQKNDLFDLDRNCPTVREALAQVYLHWEDLDGDQMNPLHYRTRMADEYVVRLAAILRHDYRPLCLLRKGAHRDSLLVRALVAMTGTSLSIMEQNSQHHFPVIMSALALRESVLRDVVKEMTVNRDAIMRDKSHPKTGPFASLDIAEIEDPELARLALLCGHPLASLNDVHRSDRDLVKLAVSLDGMDFEAASDDLRSDREIICIAVSDSRIEFDHPLDFAGHEHRSDRELAELAVLFSGVTLDALNDELKADRDLVELAVRSFGVAFQHSDEGLHGDRELAKLAVINFCNALENLAVDWSEDAEIMHLASLSWAKNLPRGR